MMSMALFLCLMFDDGCISSGLNVVLRVPWFGVIVSPTRSLSGTFSRNSTCYGDVLLLIVATYYVYALNCKSIFD